MHTATVRYLVIVGLVAGGAHAFGQPLSCTASANAQTYPRAGGLTEPLHDLLLSCTGGTPTPAGQAIPVYSVTLTLNTNVTSRLLSGGYLDALLLIDEPWPVSPNWVSSASCGSPRPANAPYQAVCSSSSTAAPGSCNYLLGTGGGASGSANSPYLRTNASTIYVGQQTGPKQVTWQGVPIDAPGPSGKRIMRLTNLRGNATQPGLMNSYGTSPLIASVAINGSPAIAVVDPEQVLAYVYAGLQVTNPFVPLCGCNSQNAALLTGGTAPAFDAAMQVRESSSAILTRKNMGLTVDGFTAPGVYDQNVPGLVYSSESGFMPTPSIVFQPSFSVSAADSGTRIRVQFSNVPSGVHIFVPTSVPLLELPGDNVPPFIQPCPPLPAGISGGQLTLVTADQNGFSGMGYAAVAGTAFVGNVPVAEASSAGMMAYATYEVMNAGGSTPYASIPAAAAFTNVGAQSGLISMSGSLAPISTVDTANSGPIPRFTGTGTTRRFYVPQDFDGNGVPDMVWQNNATRQVTVNYLGGPGGTALMGFDWLRQGLDGSGWHVAAVGDFDPFGGVSSLIWVNDQTHQVTVHNYGGPGGTTLMSWYWLYQGSTAGWHIAGTGNFEGFLGANDVVWQNDTTGQVTVNYFGLGRDGPTLNGWNWLYPQGVPGWHVVAVADFNGDFISDVVWMKDDTRQVTVNYFGGPKGATLIGWNWLNQAGARGWHVVGARDINGDGTPDLIWVNDATGQVTVNYYGGFGGATLIGWDWLYPVGNTGWTLIN